MLDDLTQAAKICAQLALGSGAQIFPPVHDILVSGTCEYLRKSERFFCGTAPGPVAREQKSVQEVMMDQRCVTHGKVSSTMG